MEIVEHGRVLLGGQVNSEIMNSLYEVENSFFT